MMVQPLPAANPAPNPSPKPAPPAARPAPANPAPAKPAADPNATGDFTEAVGRGDPNATGDFTEADGRADPNATGDFTEAAGGRDPNATGDFTEADGRADPNATGDFTEPDSAGRSKDLHAKDTRPAKTRLEKVKASKSATSDADAADVPPRLGGYEVLKALGKGGMGAVLLGRQISLDRKVALKVMHPKIATNPGFVARFTREAYAAAQLTHHNVVQIYDIGEDAGRHFFSMEFIAGQSLADLVKKEGRLAPEVAVGYILQAARGLRYGHKQGMVHRDIKPDNLLINAEGIVKVADLGLVKLPSGELAAPASSSAASDGDDTQLTRAGAVMGTPMYMAPEQARDSAAVDHRADIYSLGCTLYVLLTGKPPFEGRTAYEIISKHQTAPLTPPEVVVKRVPKALSAILMKMMAKKPEDRYQSMDEVIAALEEFLGLEKTGPFNPKEEQADQLEKCCHQFNYRSRSGLKRTLAAGFTAVCLLGIVGAALAGWSVLAGGLVGLFVLTPLAYFVVHGLLTGSELFRRTRAVLFGLRIMDWVYAGVGGLLLLLTLWLFGWLWVWLGFAVLAVGLALVLWFVTDRAQAAAQEEPLLETRQLLKTLRLQGLDEEQVRQFVCKYSGPDWEAFFEALFGYEAKLAARAYRKGATGEVSRPAGIWREPIIAWLDARLEAQQQARERRHLQKVEAQALEAEGVARTEAQAQARALADELVEQAAEAHKARQQGQEVNVQAMVAAARERRRPRPGFNLAGRPLRSVWLKHFVNDWFGRRLRFLLGVLLFGAGLLWVHQNGLLKDQRAWTAIAEGDLATAQQAAQQAAEGAAQARTQPLRLPAAIPVPELLRPALNSWALPATGLLVLLNGMVFFGWRPTVVTVPGAALALLGPQLGIPDVGPLTAQQVSLIAGAVLIMPVAWLVRH
jgi:serine/threonine protein kinase